MRINIYLWAGFVFLSVGSGLNGAAVSRSLSLQRVVNLMVPGHEEGLEESSPDLYKGIQYFTGTLELSRNFEEARGFFYKATKNRDLKIRTKACLYNAAILFLSGIDVERNPLAAANFFEEIVYLQSAADSDRIRACIFLDEMMHTPDGGIPLNLDKLRKLIAAVGPLCTSSGALADELCYRAARAYLYEDGRGRGKCCKSAAMCLGTLFNVSGSLADDINVLRSKISEVQSPKELGGMFHGLITRSRESSLPDDSSHLPRAVQAEPPVRFFGGLVSQNNRMHSLSDDIVESPKKDEESQRGSFRKSPVYFNLAALENTVFDDENDAVVSVIRSPMPKVPASKLKLTRRDASENSASSSSPDQALAQGPVVRLDRPLTPEDWRAIRAVKHDRSDKKSRKGKRRDKKRYRE